MFCAKPRRFCAACHWLRSSAASGLASCAKIWPFFTVCPWLTATDSTTAPTRGTMAVLRSWFSRTSPGNCKSCCTVPAPAASSAMPAAWICASLRVMPSASASAAAGFSSAWSASWCSASPCSAASLCAVFGVSPWCSRSSCAASWLCPWPLSLAACSAVLALPCCGHQIKALPAARPISTITAMAMRWRFAGVFNAFVDAFVDAFVMLGIPVLTSKCLQQQPQPQPRPLAQLGPAIRRLCGAAPARCAGIGFARQNSCAARLAPLKS